MPRGSCCTIFIDDPPVVGVLVHDVDADPFLLVPVDVVAFRQFGQAREVVIREPLVPEIEIAEHRAVFLVPLVDQLEEEELCLGKGETGEYLGDDPVLVAVTNGGRSLEALAQQTQQLLLLPFWRGAERFVLDKEEVVGNGVAVEEYLLVGKGAIGPVVEPQGAALLVVAGAIHDQPVDDVPLGLIGQGLVDPEHVLAERAAIAPVADPVPADDELVSR